MIRITAELLPHGDADRARLLGVAEITLTSTTKNGRIGSYHTRLSHTGKWYAKGKWWLQANVEGVERLKETPWHTIVVALASAALVVED